MPLNPTGSEIPRSLTEIGTTIDAALDSKADFVRVTDNPAGNTVASSYEITGSLSHTGGGVVTPLVLDYVSPNFWADSVGGSLVVSSGKWLLTLDFQAVWLSNETIATPPEDCVWGADENTVGDPILAFTRATVATTGQFALADDGVYDPVMWQNIGDDVTPNWVPLTTATALSAHTTATGNVHGLSAANVRSILAVSTLSGSNTGDQNLAPYATTSAVAAGYQPLDADLTAIAALATTSTGRSLLTESTAQTGTGALVRAASPTLTGTLNAAGVSLSANARFTEQTYTPTGTTQTIDLNSGNLNTLSLGSTTGDVTLTLTVPTSAASGRIKIIQHGTTARGITIALSAGTAVWYSAIPAFSSQAISKKTMLSYTWDGTDMSLQAAEAI
jgi:hypothetical protein